MSQNKIDLYDYDLPRELIAQQPLARRSASRLLELSGDTPPGHRLFQELPKLLQKGDLLVRNTTRVFPARLRGYRSGGGKTELLLVREISDGVWECLARPASSLREGRIITFASGRLIAVVAEKHRQGRVVVNFEHKNGGDFWALLEEIGEVPLPPYIKRHDVRPDASDKLRYQTIYAKERGAVAAPTAGLHFTDALLVELQSRGIDFCDILLHVGPGTFRPIKCDNIKEHKMDAEYFEISNLAAKKINSACEAGRRIIAIGTTSVRALESACSENGRVEPCSGYTEIFIYSPYKFKAVDGIITNFHLPKSTLMLLVSAFCGRDRLLAAYAEAVSEKYRFYSYGDAMLVLP